MDAPVIIENEEQWLLNQLGERFVGLYFIDTDNDIPTSLHDSKKELAIDILTVGKEDANIIDKKGLIQQHYDATPGTFYLIRPDQHVAGRWRNYDSGKVEKAFAKVTGH